MVRLLIFASGTKDGGGSGFQELVENSRTGILNAEIVAVVSNHPEGGVKKRADKLKIPFVYFPGPFEGRDYQKIVTDYKTDFIALSGWLKHVKGIDPTWTINIHPGPLPRFGGSGMYGHYVHEAVIKAFKKGEIKYSAVTMHFVTRKYDEGPIFFQYPVLIREEDTVEILAERVNKIEHGWQSFITNLVVSGQIKWDGKNSNSLTVPSWYAFHKPFKF
ncbi:MAG: phosphoribosylglycinamide formyltransferase [Candidatus Aenigmarchaeota archaeon]|nr:phosphoribosylglycinamide formyltransferase [Candidatus Aenigmarchaeota archaeon]